jgi:hypothetical protein
MGGNENSFSAFSDSQMAQDKLQNEAFPPNAATSVPEKSQVLWKWDGEFSKKNLLDLLLYLLILL